MSKAPDRCLYCKGDDPNCGFCEMGKPLDTQEDWDNSWGKVLGEDKRVKHNHITRGFRPRGQCPACDLHHMGLEREFYADPANLEPKGPAIQRKSPREQLCPGAVAKPPRRKKRRGR